MENKGTIRVLLVYALLILHSHVFANSLKVCSALAKLTMAEDRHGNLKPSKENYEAFDQQRRNLIEAYTTLSTRFREMDHVIKTLFIALMGETHAFIYGEPGGAKSAIARAILNMPIMNPETGEFERSVFAIQMQQLLGDQPFKGFIDYEKLDAAGKEKLGALKKLVKVSEVQNRGTLIQFERGLIDELEKGNPIAAAAILDVLNEKIAQYGSITVKVKTRTVATTSNMTPYEFLQMMTDLGMESTAKPFLDRLVYKIYAHNWITDKNLRIAARKDKSASRKKKKRGYLTNPSGIRTGRDAEEVDPDSLIDIKLPEVDFIYLGGMAEEFFAEPDLYHATENIYERLRKRYGDKRMETKALWQANRQEALPPYFPPFIFSTRNHLEYTDPTIFNSLLLDLMLVPVDRLPSKDLLDLMASGAATVGLKSSYRASQLVTTNAVGGARLVPNKAGDKWTLQWGTQLDKLIEAPLDDNEKASRVYINWERVQFTELWEEEVNKILTERKVGSRLLSDLAAKLGIKTKSKAGVGDFEELLLLLNPTEVEN